MQITSGMVKELREKTGAGLMDCKAALTASGGDMEAAIDHLRTKGLAAAAKKSSRIASEGVVCAHVEGNSGALVEVNCETDFVARTDDFVGLAKEYRRAGQRQGAAGRRRSPDVADRRREPR